MTRRNKVDGQGKHPWKAEVSEDDADISPTIISNWYQEEVRTVWPEKKPDLKFLHKVTDGNEKIGEE